MKVAVLGAGAIGAYVGAALHRGGAEVHLIARRAHGDAMRAHGVRVLSPRGNFTVRPHVTDDPAQVGPVDFVFLGLKANSYASCGPLIAPLLGEDTAIVAAQNGIPWWYFHGLTGHPLEDRRVETVDPGGAVSEVLELRRAIGCVVYCSTVIEEPGVIRHLEGTRFALGEPKGGVSSRCAALADALIAGGLKAPVELDLRDEIWVKLMGNVAFNPLSALTRATMVQMCEHPDTRELVATMMNETLAIARAAGSDPKVSVEKRINGAWRVGHHKTSMLQDLEAGKPLEIDAIIGAVVELAELTGVSAPALRHVHAAIGLLDQTANAVPVGAH
ncbi:2-dehydropantoate 2-reductase [Amycolatopsis umgeniensis]|uniref:2-dehydropantoate 2-reductase n=1 Tax=Amycolatopsis umgeniensis TaxID=336628 RepID=A0A841AVJ7_9PSEU|nr:2-dehydropantoate 2-reductase [Amycolatopsis umgeniensis]MBB5850405.1 2-dehydropantoate 2-reductase [Amycolatopsis umgeniensis]